MSKQAGYGSSKGWNPAAIMRDLTTAWRLLWDPRVPMALKIMLPAAAMVYWLSPIDLLPGLPIDDVALMLVALHLFVQMAPAATKTDPSGTRSTGDGAASTGPTVDTTWTVIDD